MKQKIVLTTDSGMCPNKRLDPIIIPDQITRNDNKSYRDNGKEITTKEILEDKSHIYKTAAPLLEDYENIFTKLLKEKNDIIHLSLGGGISSSSINNAILVANELNERYKNKIYVIDSCTGSIGGTCYYERAFQQLANSNLPAKQIKEQLEQIKKQIHTSFYVPDPTGFIKSGRDKSKKHSISSNIIDLSSKILNMTSLKYRVDFHENGDLFLKKIFRSSKHQGMLKMIQEIINKNTIYEFENDICTIANLEEKDINMKEIYEYINSLNYFKKIIRAEIGNVVAPYGCNDLCGISLVKKK